MHSISLSYALGVLLPNHIEADWLMVEETNVDCRSTSRDGWRVPSIPMRSVLVTYYIPRDVHDLHPQMDPIVYGLIFWRITPKY